MKKLTYLFTTIIIMLSLNGCSTIGAALKAADTLYFDQKIAEAEAIPRIGFSTGAIFEDEKEIVLKASDFTNMQSEYSVYRSSMHFDTLTPDEQTVYHAFEYALENGYSNILIDDLLISNSETLVRILDYLSLDSPLLEQNLWSEHGSFTTYYPIEDSGIIVPEAEFDGYFISVDNFESIWWDKKQEALKKAVSIVDTLPPDLTDAQKAEELFCYIAECAEYEYSEDSIQSVQPYLYDALITGKTHCDGFTNALSLLYNLAGIECFEKRYSSTEEAIGHTWNCFSIDGAWYNADSTGKDMIPSSDSSMHAGRYFAYSDILQEYKPDYSSIYPASTDSLYMPIDAHLSDTASDEFINAIRDGYQKHNYEWTLLLLDSSDTATIEARMQDAANSLERSLHYTLFELIDNRTGLLIYSGSLLE